MRTGNQTLEQQAIVRSATHGVQVVREGFFMPAQPGMQLLPGDRVVAESGARAIIEFTGVNDALVIENAAAATFNLEVVEPDQPPQWIASDLFGQGVYFDSNAANRTASAGADNASFFGLFSPNPASGGDFPVAEAAVGLLAVGAIAADYDSDDTAEQRTNTGENNGPPPTDNGDDDGGDDSGNGDDDGDNGNTDSSPLDPLLDPITDLLDGLFAAGGANSPLSTLQAPADNANGLGNLLQNLPSLGQSA
ncbi:MAG TPA: hypothetical protein VFV39_09875 [Limnobacter sp.]|nr:hypothetical protein [Limnobacter sp.]